MLLVALVQTPRSQHQELTIRPLEHIRGGLVLVPMQQKIDPVREPLHANATGCELVFVGAVISDN